MTISLITGGAGFIGSHLAEQLLAKGQEVYVIDDLSTGSIRNIQPFKANPRFHYEIDTLMHEKLLAELVDSVDVIYHLAATVGVFLVAEAPVNTIETTVKGTELVLKWANKKKRRVLLTSTSEVYGKGVKLPFTETDDLLIGPSYMGRWSYASSKLLDEFMAMGYHKQYGLPAIVTRLFNTVGPRQSGRYGMVVPRFVAQALTGEPLTIFGDGQQSRCFCHVEDVAMALIGLMEHPDTPGQLYNVGAPQEVTIKALAERVIALTGSSSELKYVPYSEAYTENFEDMRRRVPNITKINATIGWQPHHNLDRILEEVIAEQSVNREQV